MRDDMAVAGSMAVESFRRRWAITNSLSGKIDLAVGKPRRSLLIDSRLAVNTERCGDEWRSSLRHNRDTRQPSNETPQGRQQSLILNDYFKLRVGQPLSYHSWPTTCFFVVAL